MKRVISVVLLFIGIQFLCVIPVMLLSTLGNVMKEMTSHPNVPSNVINPTLLAYATLCFEVLMIAVLALLRWIKSNFNTWKEINLKTLALCLVPALFCSVFVNGLSEYFELPDDNQEIMFAMVHTVPGIITIAMIAPICEEITFRDAIQGYLHRNGYKAWHCIVASSLIFGIVHMNPAQIPFAFMMGMFLGWLYYKTGSIMPGVVCHIMNNGMAVASMLLFDKDDSIHSEIGYSGLTAVVIASGIIFAVLAYMLNKYFDKNINIRINENIDFNENN